MHKFSNVCINSCTKEISYAKRIRKLSHDVWDKNFAFDIESILKQNGQLTQKQILEWNRIKEKYFSKKSEDYILPYKESVAI